jgi:hypothetical protein
LLSLKQGRIQSGISVSILCLPASGGGCSNSGPTCPTFPCSPFFPLMQFSFPLSPSLISFGAAAVVSHFDGTLHVELSFLVGRRARAGVCVLTLPSSLSVHSALGAIIFLVDGRFGIGSYQDQQERESVMALGNPAQAWSLHSNST